MREVFSWASVSLRLNTAVDQHLENFKIDSQR